ncbi:MAG: serine/threonine protein kinase [Sandaracinaceae bacterium]|nr:serine/threonine protein kinase [Sandaracinaceae bacterium]
MAEVFKGEAMSVQGFKKQVAIKRVLPHLAQNKNFISMFLDEARLGARLSHANIVTVFDIGAADNTFFIVMEFIDGCNLKAVIEEHRQQGRRIPVKEAVYIAIEACKGLSFAHEVQDDDGVDLHIVHRDISPPNILISKRGEVKVTDFGLAKATTQLEKTDPGVVKGKFSYLSPEAALGEPVDMKTDVYATGIVLWEMLAGRRLYLGETDYQTVKLVQQSNIPSLSRINPEVDAELERVIGKALEKDTTKRFQNARDFGDALAHYLFSRQLKVTSFDVANLVKWVIDSKKATKSGQKPEQSIIDRLIQEELLRFTSLDDVEKAVTIGQDSGDKDGAAPLDAGLFENPADWFADDNDVQNAVETRARDQNHGPRWAETGVEEPSDLSDILEDKSEPPPPRASMPDKPPVTSAPEVAPRVSSPPAAPAAPVATAEPAKLKTSAEDARDRPAEAPKSNAMLYVAIAIVVIAGAGAAAYFGGFLG